MGWRRMLFPGALGWLALAAAGQSLDVPSVPAAPSAPSAPATQDAPAPSVPGSPSTPAIPPGGSGGQLGADYGFNLSDGQGKDYNWNYRYRWDNGQGQEDSQLRTSPSQPGTGVNFSYGDSLGYNSTDANNNVNFWSSNGGGVSVGAPPAPFVPPQNPQPAAAPAPDAQPEYFDKGDSAADVKRVQGQPDSITPYPAIGYDIWRYGYSQVKISTTTGRVLSWANISRNLRVPPPDQP